MDDAANLLLNDVRVASPCAADWNEMSGSDHARSCERCQRTVYNLSEMTAAEAATFVRDAEGRRVCVRFHRRADGMMLTRDDSFAPSAQTAQAPPSPHWGLARRAGVIGLTMASAASLAHANPPKTAEKPQAAHHAQTAHKAKAAQPKASPAAARPKTPATLSALPPSRQATEPETVPQSAASREGATVPPTIQTMISYVTQGELAALPTPPPPPVLEGKACVSTTGILSMSPFRQGKVSTPTAKEDRKP